LGRVQLDPQPLIYPLPVALVACLELGGGPNVLVVSWITSVCASPPLIGVSLRPHRYSTQVIQETGEFTVNFPSHEMAVEVDLCGGLSGRDVEKLRVTGLTQTLGDAVRAPLIAECPVNLECTVRQTLALGSHILFIAEVMALHVDGNLCHTEDDQDEPQLDFLRATPLIYAPQSHDYWKIDEAAGCIIRSTGKKP
jgi:flavin reductase (DIM6/NTAB) family NADH-FMN oxidoreductase RutF